MTAHGRSAADRMNSVLRSDLRVAMAERDAVTVRVLRQAISAIENGGAVPAAGHAPNVGSTGDVPRRELTEEQVQGILRRESQERQSAITEYGELGMKEMVTELEAEVQVLAAYLNDVGRGA